MSDQSKDSASSTTIVLRQTLTRRPDFITSVAWSSDGFTIASGSEDTTIRVWDAETGKLRLSIEGHTAPVRSLAWSPDALCLASGSDDRSVQICNCETGSLIHRLEAHTAPVVSLVWSPDGQMLASGSEDKTILLWDVASGKLLRALKGHSSRIRALTWFADGLSLASGSDDGSIRIWDPKTGRLLQKIKGDYEYEDASVRHQHVPSDLQFLYEAELLEALKPDSKDTLQDKLSKLETTANAKFTSDWNLNASMFAISLGRSAIIIFDAKAGEMRTALTGHLTSVISLAWSPDGQMLASGLDDETIQLWDVKSRKSLLTLSDSNKLSLDNIKKLLITPKRQQRSSPTFTLAWSPDGQTLASGSKDKSVRLWNTKTGKVRHTFKEVSGIISSLAWQPAGRLLASGSEDTTIRVWDAETGKLRLSIEGHTAPVRSLAWSPDALCLASGSDDRSVQICNCETGSLIHRLEAHTAPVVSLVWSPDGQMLASGSEDKTILLWDVASGKLLRALKGHSSRIRALTWFADGLSLASGSDDGSIRIWDPKTGQSIVSSTPVYDTKSIVQVTDFSGSNAPSIGKLKIIDFGHAKLHPPHSMQTRAVHRKEWSPGRQFLASWITNEVVGIYKNRSVKFFDTINDQQNSFSIDIGWLSDTNLPNLNPDERAILIVDTETSKLRHKLKSYNYLVSAALWSPNGQKLAVASDDGKVRLWCAITGNLLRVCKGQSDAAQSLAWSPDSCFIAAPENNIPTKAWKNDLLQRNLLKSGVATNNIWLDNFIDGAVKLPPVTIQVWDAETGKLRLSIEGHTAPVRSLAWSPDALCLASGSDDRSVQICNCETGSLIHRLEAHTAPVVSLVWSPDGQMLASGSEDKTILLWDVASGKLLRALKGHSSRIRALTWFADGLSLASGSDDGSIRIWDPKSGKARHTLEGHSAPINTLTVTPDGELLASGSDEGSIRLWRCSSWEIVEVLGRPASKYLPLNISFETTASSHKIIGREDAFIRTWKLNADALLNSTSDIASIRYTSAKIVLVGESNVGKSCLALRLAEDRYEEQGTTHGMRIWSLNPEKLNPNVRVPAGEKREIVLWDMGGQDEYRLVHQLFLHDTSLALLLLDPTRGRTAFEEIEGWNLRLEKQLQGRKTIKLLVGTKLDEDTPVIDRARLEDTVSQGQFSGYFLTSAKLGRNVSELRAAISEALDWETLAKTSRPALFQRIRDEIERRRKKGDVVLLCSELEEKIRREDPKEFDLDAINAVVKQLAIQGMIADTRLGSGERVLVLQIGEIERYAGSLIIAARNNPRGVPAIEEIMVTSARMSFPGINEPERLHPFQERIVLECVVQLLLEHGICLKHEGLLIFPSLFQSPRQSRVADIPHSISLYYDFSGAIDNIYSSLVVQLAISEQFGRVRLWEDRAEFEQAGHGICGLRKVEYRSGLAHLDLFFSEQTSSDRRAIFTIFVEDHLRKEGVKITEVLEVTCVCGYRFQESSLRKRFVQQQIDICCPECETRSPISQGAKKARTDRPDMEMSLLALKTIIHRKSEQAVAEVKKAFEEAAQIEPAIEPIRILHLSDLHINHDDDPASRLQPLIRDLEDTKDGLGLEYLDYLIISGDLTNHASAEEFEQAYRLISGLVERFKLTAERCVIAPGNHDLNWDQSVYEWKQNRVVERGKLKEGSYYQQGDGLLIRNEKEYARRFENFKKFYHSLLQQEYPLEVEEQCIPILFEDTKIQFLLMNSSWEIDEFFPARSSINDSALSRGLVRADKQIKSAIEAGRLHKGENTLRVAVWHHPITGNEKISDDAFLERLQQEDVRLCLHGHIHENRADLVGYLHPTRKIHVIGAGSFGAPMRARPESVPRLYNLLEISRDLNAVRVRTRCLRKQGGAWEGWAVWPGDGPNERRTFYDITLDSSIA